MAVSDYSGLISSAESANNLPPGLMSAVLTQESGGDPNAVSSAGAQGVAQLMPATAASLGVTDPTDPSQAIPAAGRYLRQQYDRFGGWAPALAAYNAGPARVARSLAQTGDIPSVTHGYVSGIVDHMVAQGAPTQVASADPAPDDSLSPDEIKAAVSSGAYATDKGAAAQVPDLAGPTGGQNGPQATPGGSQGASGGNPAPPAAPTVEAPLPGLTQDPRDPQVWRDASGAVGAIGPGGPQSTTNPDGSVEMNITGSANPAFIRDYLGKHPQLAAPPQAPGAGDDQLSPEDMQTALAGGYSLSPGGPIIAGGAAGQGGQPPGGAGALVPSLLGGGGDPGAPKDPLAAILRATDTTMRSVANAATGGLADKAEAAYDALLTSLPGGFKDFGKQYSANMDAQQERDRADAREEPMAYWPSTIAGGVAQGAMLPEVGASSMLGRAAVGAGQGMVLGGLDGMAGARGGPAEIVRAAVPGMLWGGALGAPLGAAFGARAAGEIPAHLATLADYDAAGVDPTLAVDGGRSLQQIAQTLKGTPIVGGPLAEAAAKAQSQVRSAVERMAGRYGTAANMEEAGAPIMAANQASANAVEAGKRMSNADIQALAAKYGGGSGRRVAGEGVQDAVSQFSQGGDSPFPNAATLPARATSFADKSGALYDQAFGRLDNEMAGGVRGTAIPPDTKAPPLPTLGAADAPGPGPSSGSYQDQALNLIRRGKTVRPNTGPSLMDFIAQTGGLHDQGGEVSAMDGDLWHRDLSHTGTSAFRRKIIQPNGLGLEDMAQRAGDAGYFPDAPPPSWSGSDNMQGVGSQDLLDAMRGELAGNKRFADYDPNAAALHGHVQDAQEMIDHLGLDPQTQSNAEMKGAMEDFLGGKSTAAGEPLPNNSSAQPADTAAAPEPPNALRPTATKAVLEDILGRAQSPAVKGLLDAPQVKTIASAMAEPGKLSFQDLRGLRTWVRQAQRNNDLRQTIGSADLQRMEGALTSDIYDNASRLASPGAAKQLRRADQFYGAGMQRINGSLRAYFKAPSGEKAFDGIVSAAQTGSQADIRKLTGLQRSLSPDHWNSVASSVINHLGETPQGFDLDTFLRGYGKLSPEGSQALFGGRNAALQRSLSSVTSKASDAAAASPTVHFGDTPASAMEGLLRASMKRGSSADIGAVKTLRSAIPDQQWGDVAAGALRSLGQKGDGFSPDQFVTAWGKLSPEARQTIFGGEGHEGDPASIESLVRVMQQQKNAGKFFNHSQSGHAAVGVLLMEHLGSILTGEVPLREATSMGATAGLGWGASKLLAYPGAARLLLRGVRSQTGADAQRIGAQMARFSGQHPDVAGPMDQLRGQWLQQLRANGKLAGGVGTAAAVRRQLLPAPSQ